MDQQISMEKRDGVIVVNPKSRAQWRSWLERNHAKLDNAWLVLYKKGHPEFVLDNPAAVEEGLCFGWIDSKVIRRDEDSRLQFFSKRKPKSNWSRINRERVKKLTDAGLMRPAGQAMVDLAKRTGTWTAMEGVENMEIPPDLAALLKKNKKAAANFHAFSPSARKLILTWIMSAKRPGTRQARVEKTVTDAADNLKAH